MRIWEHSGGAGGSAGEQGFEERAPKTWVVPPCLGTALNRSQGDPWRRVFGGGIWERSGRAGGSAAPIRSQKKLAVCFWGWDLGTPMRVWERSGRAGSSAGEGGLEERAPKTRVVPLRPGTAPNRSQKKILGGVFSGVGSGHANRRVDREKSLAAYFQGWDLGMPMRIWEHAGRAGGFADVGGTNCVREGRKKISAAFSVDRIWVWGAPPAPRNSTVHGAKKIGVRGVGLGYAETWVRSDASGSARVRPEAPARRPSPQKTTTKPEKNILRYSKG
ncbi:hypothetical protein DFH08DRAFT_820477 [Mycena albidolilacea]|uniref:Uncharacterized protein n=1 Tax=Mycena albidolilacea TaxID=1033008 RepID=A0AAD6ZCZ9_9AGAR|nr:hypothetical protein DFH08DRAFT_820477 [Mycena albidolilacea]